MTREEAISTLDDLIGMIDDNHNTDYDDALRMAIEALRQPDYDLSGYSDKLWKAAYERGKLDALKSLRDCRSCRYGHYNDHIGTGLCYSPNKCVNWNKWEAEHEPD